MTEEKPTEPELPKTAEPTGDDDDADGYAAKYIRSSKVKELFVDGDGEKAVKIRISGDTKADVWKFLDDCVAKGVQELIARLPRKSKGDRKGELSRITISKEEFAPKKE